MNEYLPTPSGHCYPDPRHLRHLGTLRSISPALQNMLFAQCEAETLRMMRGDFHVEVREKTHEEKVPSLDEGRKILNFPDPNGWGRADR